MEDVFICFGTCFLRMITLVTLVFVVCYGCDSDGGWKMVVD